MQIYRLLYHPPQKIKTFFLKIIRTFEDIQNDFFCLKFASFRNLSTFSICQRLTIDFFSAVLLSFGQVVLYAVSHSRKFYKYHFL